MGVVEKNPRCSPATGISRKKETNYTFNCTYFRPNVGQTTWKNATHCRGATGGCWEGKFGTLKTVVTFDSMSNKLRKRQLKMARNEVENMKLKRAADKQIYDLLLKHQVKSG